ncbi:MAG: hypothetical protein WDN31_14165 [Hyphomicrobium sp.]
MPVPAGVVTTTSTSPGGMCRRDGGDGVVVDEGNGCRGGSIEGAPVTPVNPVPVMVTAVPPSVVPVLGLTARTVGGAT